MPSDIAGLREQIKDNAETILALSRREKNKALVDSDLKIIVYNESLDPSSGLISCVIDKDHPEEPFKGMKGSPASTAAEALSSLLQNTAARLSTTISEAHLAVKYDVSLKGQTNASTPEKTFTQPAAIEGPKDGGKKPAGIDNSKVQTVQRLGPNEYPPSADPQSSVVTTEGLLEALEKSAPAPKGPRPQPGNIQSQNTSSRSHHSSSRGSGRDKQEDQDEEDSERHRRARRH